MFVMKLTVLFVVLILTFTQTTPAQSFGFGCLGFVGGYGGYSYQVYKPTGLNNYIQYFNDDRQDSLSTPMSKFGKAQGYRVGINFFRADIRGFILTAKGFYQLLTEKHNASVYSSLGNISTTYKLNVKNWGVGIDLGTSLTGGISWKVIDAALLFNSAKLTNTTNSPGPTTTVLEYKNTSSKMGYSIGTGFIVSVIDQYVTLEGLAGYTDFSISELQQSDGTKLTVNENSKEPMKNFIETGGFNAVIQLNLGFPL